MVNRQRRMVKKKKAGNKFATVIGYVPIHTYVSELAVSAIAFTISVSGKGWCDCLNIACIQHLRML
ncbi:hypothetical protein [Nostoc sp. C110]|uniref:hypothetical protein n=1 Tax=Nostoc sp. C110 TaxID=3349876 RepID=UPI00370DDBE5